MSIRALPVAAAALLLAAGCSSGAPPTEPTGQVSAALSPALTYYGGPVIQHVKVFAIWWGAVSNEQQLASFYGAVTNGSYMDWLAEYGPPGQPIGRGTFIGSASAPATSLTTIDDSVIETTLESMIASGKLPKPDANTLYMNHFAPGLTVTVQGATSCQQFCAYNSTFISASTKVPVVYGVVPDMGGACVAGCGIGTNLQSTTRAASDAMIDAVTDPDVSLNPYSLAAPLGWYDPAIGQVAEVCGGGQWTTTSDGWVVQKGWSNLFGACIAQDPAPSCSAATDCGSSVAVTCQAYPQPLTVLRTDPGGAPHQVGSLPQAGGTYWDTAPGATATYQVCGATACTAPMSVTVNQTRCAPKPPPPKCGALCM
jgi:hypothetical protein